MDESIEAAKEGANLRPQISGRPFGLLIGLQTYHAFAKRPTFRALQERTSSFEELAARLREPAVKAAILSEDDLPPEEGNIFDGMSFIVRESLDKIYVLGDPPDYEPTDDKTVTAIAKSRDVAPLDLLYDLFLEQDGRAMLLMPVFNYAAGDCEAIREQLTHPYGVSGLSDGGAHCGMICDASIPTFLLTHWARDRSRGEKLELEWVVQKQSCETARLFGLDDRGTLEVGQKADLNVIDFENLVLRSPRLDHDLPAGGRRLLQDAEGYDYTIVSGEVTREHGKDTGARPGRLIRGPQPAAA